MFRILYPAALLATLFAFTGCSRGPVAEAVPDLPQAMPVNPPEGSPMLTFNTFAGDALHKMLLLRADSGGGILAASFVDINDFGKTSAFGRIASQQVASRLGQYGFRVIEARLAGELSMTPGPAGNAGEFMLSRDAARLLSDTYAAAAVLVGCYSDNGNVVSVSARVVRLSDNTILAAYEYFVPRDAEVGNLLFASSGRGASGGNGVWARYGARDQAFSPGETGADPGAPRARAVPRAVLPKPGPGSEPAAVAKSGAAPVPPVKGKGVQTPPAVTSAPVPPQASPAPLTGDKDAPAPEGTPGG